ncbi:MAG: PAS domain-containing protein [Potamolinea sp.]
MNENETSSNDQESMQVKTDTQTEESLPASLPTSTCLEQAQQRAELMWKQLQELPDTQQEPMKQALGELSNALEELRVTMEELQCQEELIAARHTVEKERKRYEELFDFAPDGYLVTDVEGTIQEANRAISELLSVRVAFLIGKPLTVFVPAAEQQKFHTQLIQSINPQLMRLQDWEVSLQPRGSVPFLGAINITAIYNEKQQIIGLRWLIRDVTERKRLEEALIKANHELELRIAIMS